MKNSQPTTTINRDFEDLAPFVSGLLKLALIECWDCGYELNLFEGLRSPQRQAYLYEQGRTSPGKIVTKARPWRSWHQYGVAVDLVYKKDGVWTWDGNYDKPAAILREYGFEWLYPFERVHFQITGGLSLDRASSLVLSQGLKALHSEIESKIG